MIVYLTASLLIISILAIIILIVLKINESKWLDEDWLYPLGRLSFALFGISVVLLAVTFYRQSWPAASFFSVLFLVLGIQITLWAVGISSEVLGNAPNQLSTILDRASLFDDQQTEWRDYAEEQYATLRQRLDLHYEELMRSTDGYNKELRKMMERSLSELSGSMERLNSELSGSMGRLKVTMERYSADLKPIKLESYRNFYRALNRHLLV